MTHIAEHHHAQAGASLRKLAFQATLHCMTGCAIGEIAGMAIGTASGLGMWQTVGLAVTLAFVTGFAFTMVPLMRNGIPFGRSLRIAFAADFISVSVMEIVDNLVMMSVPGAMAAGPFEWLFWASMALALAIAFAAALPVNLWMLSRGRGHAALHRISDSHTKLEITS
jgi:hypothetical protein